MKNLSELELRILSEIEEVGFEDIPTLMNTILNAAGGADEIESMQSAIANLMNAGLVEIQMHSLPGGVVKLTREQALSEVALLTSNLSFVVAEEIWTDIRMTGPPYFAIPVPEVAYTQAGLEVAVKILTERGYQWWRPIEN